jgi:hypothetical protein
VKLSEDERQAPSGEKVAPVGKTEMQVGAVGGAAVPDLAEEHPGLHYIVAKVSAVSMRRPSMAIRRSLWMFGLQQPLLASHPSP